MKRSEVVLKIKQHLENYDTYLDDEELTDEADYILNIVESLGMKPPLSTCKMVEDTYTGGTKHGLVEHKWDEDV